MTSNAERESARASSRRGPFRLDRYGLLQIELCNDPVVLEQLLENAHTATTWVELFQV